MLFRICAVLCNFYPRPPRGGRPVCFAAGRVSVSISIHALREEGDSSPIFKKVAILNFYPRPPRGGRRGVCAGIVAPELISIHALREEGDAVHSPAMVWKAKFLSTPSARRATGVQIHTGGAGADFYPRPPRGGRRWIIFWPCPFRTYFYPRPPRGGRHGTQRCGGPTRRFLSTPSARRATTAVATLGTAAVFLSTPSARRATYGRKCCNGVR